MHTELIPLNKKISFRAKARLNICIAKDLAENFGNNKAFYLKKLNQKLRTQIVNSYDYHILSLAKAA
jgi:hypothetical protein